MTNSNSQITSTANDLLSAQMLLTVLERGFKFVDILIDEMPMIVLICDGSTRIIRANKLACKMTDRDQSQLIGAKLTEVIDKKGQKYLDQFFLDHSLNSKNDATLSYINDGDSPIFWQIKTINLGDSSAPRILVIGTLVKEYGQQISAETAAKTHLQSLATLAGGVAHEINNPLAIVSGQLEMIKESLQIPDQKTQKIDRSIDRIVRIVLGLRRFGESHLSGAKSTLDVCQVVQDAFADLEKSFPEESQNITINNATNIAIVGDFLALRSAFFEIMKNALDAVRPLEKARQKIELTVTPSTECVVIVCSDRGIGMNTQEQARIFDPFYTNKDVGDGTGLGMTLAHSAVALSQGTIKVDSTKGQGTTVTITIKRYGVPDGYTY